MRLRKNKILTGACLSLMCLASAPVAQAAPKEAEITETQEIARAETLAQGRFGGTMAQYEVVGHVRSIVGHVVTVHIEEEATIGVAGIGANDGEPTFVSVEGSEQGQVRAMYMSHNALGVTGLIPGMRIYASVSDRGGKDCIDYFKVLSAATYEEMDLGAVRSLIRRELRNLGTPVVPQLPELPPAPPARVRPSRPRPVTPQPPPPVRGLW